MPVLSEQDTQMIEVTIQDVMREMAIATLIHVVADEDGNPRDEYEHIGDSVDEGPLHDYCHRSDVIDRLLGDPTVHAEFSNRIVTHMDQWLRDEESLYQDFGDVDVELVQQILSDEQG